MPTATIRSAATKAASDAELPLYEPLDPALDAVSVFRRLSALPHVLFFDSAMRHPTRGRYSFVAADPVDWLMGSRLPALPNVDDAGTATVHNLPPARGSTLPPFQGGWAGMFGYELGRSFERIPAAASDEFGMPALALGLYDVVVAFDHADQTSWIISQGWPETGSAARRERARERLTRFRSVLAGTSPRDLGPRGFAAASAPSAPDLPAAELVPQHAVAGFAELTSNFSAEGYRRAVRQVIDYIYAGDVFQVNLSQRLLYPARCSSVELYCRLRECNPAPFAGYFDGGAWQICSASPERFLSVRKGRVETRPIKGTRRRAENPAEDRRAIDELLASEKDRAENVMIVDLLRNDLARTCRADSVRVAQLCGLESFASVHHLVSVVQGELREGRQPLDLLGACFPGGSITGVPKIRAMQIIAELEPTARGPYCGSLGYLSPDGQQMDTSILIRTITAGRGWWQIPVGGGIVADSDPDAEYAETWHKAEALLRAIRAHAPG
jgi:para-aminobenzoate synthetase component 1